MPPAVERKQHRRKLQVEILGSPEELRKWRRSVTAQFSAYHRTSQFERDAYRDLTPAQVMQLRRHLQVSQRRFPAMRPVARRRTARSRSRSPGRLADDPELAAAPLGGAT